MKPHCLGCPVSANHRSRPFSNGPQNLSHAHAVVLLLLCWPLVRSQGNRPPFALTNRLTPIQEPKPLLADRPEIRRAGPRACTLEAPAWWTTERADLHVRAWRWSYNARGIIEMPHHLRAKRPPWSWFIRRASMMVRVEHRSRRAWPTLHAAKNHRRPPHARVIQPVPQSPFKVAFVMYLPSDEKARCASSRRSFNHTPSGQASRRCWELRRKLTSFHLSRRAAPATLQLLSRQAGGHYFQAIPGPDAGRATTTPAFGTCRSPSRATSTCTRTASWSKTPRLEPLKKFLLQHGVRHILLTGYATDMCFARTCAGPSRERVEGLQCLSRRRPPRWRPSRRTRPRRHERPHLLRRARSPDRTQVSWIRFDPGDR